VSTPRSRTPLILGIVLAVVAVAAIATFLLTSGGDDGADADEVTGLVHGEVTVTGDDLPEGEGADDGAVGSAAPTLAGTNYAGDPVAITPGEDGPLMIVVMAHWCPHCNREVPLLLEWKESGDVPEGLTVVGLSTAANEDRPNFPPGQWLEDLGWDWPVIADDEPQTGAIALGTTGYPYLVFVDGEGTVLGRYSGELPIDAVQQLADATVAAAG
jgi:thiol-disulfide isomerase/thioredoxin